MPELDTPAPAQTDTPPTPPTAADQAVVTNDVSAYRAARQAERRGTPLAPAPESPAGDPTPAEGDETPEPAPAPGTERKLSKRQQQINDYERQLAELRAENARLQTLTPAAPRSAPTTEPTGPTKITYPAELATYDAYLAAHDAAPYDEYLDARADFRAETREQQAKARDAHARTSQARDQRRMAYVERLTAARTADPQFDTRISAEVAALNPIDNLGPDDPITPHNAIAQEIILSDDPATWLRHLSDHPEDLRRLATLEPRLLLREMGKIEARFERPPAPAPKPVTSAPPPPTTLGSKPAEPTDELESAVASGDVSRYRALRLSQRTAALR